MTLVHALPIRDLRSKVGNQTGCGGMAVILVDFEPSAAFEVVNAVTEIRPNLGGDQELVDFCVANVADGVRLELLEHLGELPAVRVVVREVFPHAVDSNESVNRRAGQDVTRQALRLSLTDVW